MIGQSGMYLLVSLPLLSVLLLGVSGRWLGRRATRLSVLLALAAFALAVTQLAMLGAAPQSTQVAAIGVLQHDPLGSLMSVLISGISLIVHLYSIRYMAEEPGYLRFFVLLDLMTAALLTMVTAADLITLLISWHLIGVLLYFLLGHDMRNRSAHRYGLWTLLTYRLGDLPLVLAAVLLYQAYDTWSLALLFERLQAAPQVDTAFGLPVVETVGALLALAAFARSAQLFLHTWLPYTMDGPTPVSALMHAGIVNAGGFVFNRFAPVFVHTSDVLHWVFLVGLATAVAGSVLMLAQNDVKKALGYSTMGQMGFMVMECGVGAFSLAIYHMIAHGLFKGTLFLGAGGVIGEARRDDGAAKDDLYTFVIERQPARPRTPWLLMAAITLAVPVAVLVLAHWLVAHDFFHKQGAVVLLFFGWVTGAQLIFVTYRMRTASVRRLVSLIVFSFSIVVLGYAAISHAFDLFLYPDPAFRERIHAAANIDLFWFDTLVVLVTLVIVAGWLMTYYAERDGERRSGRRGALWIGFYGLVSREFHLVELYARLSDSLMAVLGRLNVWLRWA